MILFLEDWEKSNAIADTSTKNRTFVHHARLLKHMGIKNHMFFLALVDQRLREIDPHNPNLSIEEVALVVQEIERNPWYFFREVARAPGQSGAKARPLEANRGNIALFWCFFNHVMTMLIQIRQTGKSFNTDVLTSLLMQVLLRDTQITMLTKDEKLRRINIQRIKDIWGALPRYLDLRDRGDAYNTEMLTVRALNNSYVTNLPQSSPVAAANAARGFSSPVMLFDEPPFQENIDEAIPAALPAGGKMRELAEEAGMPYGTIFTTTASRKDTKSGAYIYKFLNGMAPWNEAYLDARNREHLYELLRANSRDKETRVNITLNHSQLGKTDEWLAKQISESVSTGEKADSDFFNRWTSGTQTNPLSVLQLETIRKSEREPLWQEFAEIGGYATRWHLPRESYLKRMKEEPSIIVFDTSDASGGDDISMRVTGIYTGELFAAGTFNNTNIIKFSEWIATWIINYDNTTMLIERRSTGIAIIDNLLLILPAHDIDPFKRLFNRIVNEPDDHKAEWAIVNQPAWRRPTTFLTDMKKHFGFATSGSGVTSRAELYGQVLSQMATLVGHLVADKVTIDQVTSLITKNGRVDHPTGEHDDMVIALILTHWFMTKTTNLRFYGIDATRVLSAVRSAKVVKPVDRLVQRQQDLLRVRIRELIEKIKTAKDDTTQTMLEHELRVVYSRVQMTDNEKLSIDELIESVKQEKLKRRMSTNNTGNPGLHKLAEARLRGNITNDAIRARTGMTTAFF